MSLWYHPLEGENAVENPLIASDIDLHGIDEAELRSGHAVTEWRGAVFRPDSADDDGTPDDVLQQALVGVPVCSARLREALEQAHIEGIQWLSVEVCHYDGRATDGYAIANVTHLVAALDLERSDYTPHAERAGVRRLRRPVLKSSAVEGYDVLRLAEWPIYLCVSHRVREVCQSVDATGWGFWPVELA